MPELESFILAPKSPLDEPSPETRYACVEFYESSNGEFAGQLYASLPSEEVNQVEQRLNTEEYVPPFALEGGQQEELPAALLPRGSFEEELKGMTTTPARDLLHPDEQLTPARGLGVQHGVDNELSVDSKSIPYSGDLFQEQVTGLSIQNSVPSLLHLDADSILGQPGPSIQSEWHSSLFPQQHHSLGMGMASSDFLQGLQPSIEALDNCQGVMRSVPATPLLHFQSASTSRRNAGLRSGTLSYKSPISEHLAVKRQNGFHLAEHLGVQRHGSSLKDLAMQSHLIRLHRKRYAMPQFMTNAVGNGQFAGNQSASLCSRGVGSHKSTPSETCLYENLLLRAQMQVLRGNVPTSRATCLERKRKQEQLRKRLAKSQAEELLQLHNTKNKAAFQADKWEAPQKRLQQLAPCAFMDDSSSDSEWEVDVEDQSGWGKISDSWQDVEQNTWNQLELQGSKKKTLRAEAKEIFDSDNIQHKLSSSFHKFLYRGDASSGESDPESSECEDSDADSDSADRATERETREAIISSRERETCDFFIREFQEKLELGKLYEDQRNCGSFVCIVCVASGRRWKKFPDLVSLVQHAKSVMKTRTRAEHRGYGRAVCEFLGWGPIGRPLSTTPRGCIPDDDTT